MTKKSIKDSANDVMFLVYHREVHKKSKAEVTEPKITRFKEFISQQDAEADIEAYNSRPSRKKEAFLVIMPKKIEKGTKIYIKDASMVRVLNEGDLYGTVTRTDSSFIYVNRAFKGENDEVFFMKDEIEQKYIDGIFIAKKDIKGE